MRDGCAAATSSACERGLPMPAPREEARRSLCRGVAQGESGSAWNRVISLTTNRVTEVAARRTSASAPLTTGAPRNNRVRSRGLGTWSRWPDRHRHRRRWAPEASQLACRSRRRPEAESHPGGKRPGPVAAARGASCRVRTPPEVMPVTSRGSSLRLRASRLIMSCRSHSSLNVP